MENDKLTPFIRIRGIIGRGYDIVKELMKRGADMESWYKIDRENLDNYWLYISERGKIMSVPVDEADPFFLEHYKEVSLPRWRAMEGERYYCITSSLSIEEVHDYNTSTDRIRYEIGNYAKTAEKLEPLREKFLEMLKEM